ncbi:MAG TPA: 2-oxo acid dehydrogenase subunit E2 [Streptosporangiaceae bacterium]|jgi:2-oxoglutarate dehydrogenase E2 component (dihydrolipoamide succinyltransferase)
MREITVPKLNNNDDSYVLVEWLAQDGAELAADAPIAVIETSKAAEELAVAEGGVLLQVAQVNASCAAGSVIGRLFPTAQARQEFLGAAQPEHRDGSPPSGDVIVTRPAREAAAEFGIDLTDLRVLGKNVLRRQDVEEFAATIRAQTPQPEDPQTEAAGEGIITLPAVQQAVGQVVTQSHQSIPAAFAAIKIPADAALGRQAGRPPEAPPIGLPELLVQAVAALRERHPLCFASYRGDGTVSVIGGAHVGVTLDLGRGLFVPVVRDAGARSLDEIAGVLTDFRISALRGSFRAAELAGGNITISLSNDADVVLARPIVFPGQTCVLALCATQEELVRTPAGEIATRRYVNVGMSYDHRVLSGRDAIAFLHEIKRILAAPDHPSDAGTGDLDGN